MKSKRPDEFMLLIGSVSVFAPITNTDAESEKLVQEIEAFIENHFITIKAGIENHWLKVRVAYDI